MASHTHHSDHQGGSGNKSGCCGGKADAGKAEQARPQDAPPATSGGCCGSKR